MNIKNRIMRQYSVMIIANFSSIAFAFLTNILMTELMAETEFGTYRYIINIITMICSFANLGIYYSTAKLLTKADAKQERNLYGATIFLIMSLCLLVAIGGTGVFVIIRKYIVNSNIRFFVYALPFVYTIMLQRTFMYMLRGSNKISDIAIQTVLPHIILIGVYTIFCLSGGQKLKFSTALIIYGVAYAITHLQTIVRLKVSFGKDIKGAVKDIVKEHSTNGFEIYKGSLMSVLTADVLNVIIGSISATAEYAVYSLALSFSSPILQVPVAMGTIQFKKNASLNKIPRREIGITVLLGICAYIGLNIILAIFFPIIYKNTYSGTTKYVLIVALGYFVHGLGDYFNYFLNSHGHGKEIKKAAYMCGIVQIIVALVLIPRFVIWGVVAARLISSLTYFLVMVHNYIKYIKYIK